MREPAGSAMSSKQGPSRAMRVAAGLLGLATAAQLGAQAPLPMLDRPEYARERRIQLGIPGTPRDLDAGPHPGKALAMDGNTLVVGAEYYDTVLTPVPQGAVVFEKRNGEWEPVAKLLPDEPVANGSQYYGQSVAIEDDLVVVSFAEDGTSASAASTSTCGRPAAGPALGVPVPRTWRLSLPLALGGGASVAIEDGVIVTGAPLASLVGPGPFDTPRHGAVVIHEPPQGGWQTPPSNPVVPRPPDHLLALASALVRRGADRPPGGQGRRHHRGLGAPVLGHAGSQRPDLELRRATDPGTASRKRRRPRPEWRSGLQRRRAEPGLRRRDRADRLHRERSPGLQ